MLTMKYVCVKFKTILPMKEVKTDVVTKTKLSKAAAHFSYSGYMYLYTFRYYDT